jgi:hypothetical protein
MPPIVVLEPAGPPDEKGHPMLRPARPSALLRRIQAALASDEPARARRLEALARGMAGGPGAGSEPAYLVLAAEEGGFARRGFWLERRGSPARFVDRYRVDLVVDEKSLEDGSFEEVFPHEMGHVILRELLGEIPSGFSRASHHSMTITDYPTAFDEGFAEHFQPIARLTSGTAALRRRLEGTATADLRDVWLDRVDEDLRTRGVIANLFVLRAAVALETLAPDGNRAELAAAARVSTAFDRHALKRGQEMMSCEGVVATLFYRFVHDPRIGRGRPETAYRELFAAMRRMKSRGIDAEHPLLLDLVRAFGEEFPSERAAIEDIVIRTTFGAIASPDAAARYEYLARSGSARDAEAFVPQLSQARRALDDLESEIRAGHAALGAAVGPEIWVFDSRSATAVNLNTAGLADLLLLPGVDVSLAGRILAARDRSGAFRSIADVGAIEGAPASLLDALRSMEAAMRAAGPLPRE